MGGQGLKVQRPVEAVATIQEHGRWLRSGWGWRTQHEVVRSCVCLRVGFADVRWDERNKGRFQGFGLSNVKDGLIWWVSSVWQARVKLQGTTVRGTQPLPLSGLESRAQGDEGQAKAETQRPSDTTGAWGGLPVPSP